MGQLDASMQQLLQPPPRYRYERLSLGDCFGGNQPSAAGGVAEVELGSAGGREALGEHARGVVGGYSVLLSHHLNGASSAAAAAAPAPAPAAVARPITSSKKFSMV
jgi:hypothetical protein